jgi:hypothetical protein
MIAFSSGTMKHSLALVEWILYVSSTHGRRIGLHLTARSSKEMSGTSIAERMMKTTAVPKTISAAT